MNASVEFAARDELREIAELLDASWREAYCRILPAEYLANLSVDRRQFTLERNFSNGSYDFLALRDGGELVGTAICGISAMEGYLDCGEISAIYVLERWIGRGYGHALLARAEELLTARGYNRFVLDVFRENSRAVRFYIPHGYETVVESTITLCGSDYPILIMVK